MNLLNPYVLLGLLAIMLMVGVGSYKSGYSDAETVAEADKVVALKRAIAQAELIAQQDAEVLKTHEQQQEHIRIVFQKIHEGVTRYVKNHAATDVLCLDADGLRLWHAANAGETSPAEPDYSLSGPAAATLGTRGGLAGQPRPGGGAVSRVQGTTAGAGGVGKE